MNRQEFLQLIGKSLLTVTGAAVVFPGCTSLHHVTATVSDNKLSIPVKEFADTKNEDKRLRDLVIIRSTSLAYPLALYRISDKEYIALWMECTHQRCEVNAYSHYLVCPCHGSEYNAKGKVVQGPAESDLKTFNVSSDHENIYIHL